MHEEGISVEDGKLKDKEVISVEEMEVPECKDTELTDEDKEALLAMYGDELRDEVLPFLETRDRQETDDEEHSEVESDIFGSEDARGVIYSSYDDEYSRFEILEPLIEIAHYEISQIFRGYPKIDTSFRSQIPKESCKAWIYE